jgi:hypothetical protein
MDTGNTKLANKWEKKKKEDKKRAKKIGGLRIDAIQTKNHSESTDVHTIS